jgi:peptidoglycan/LPS O-acetylase OafA/YrhL
VLVFWLAVELLLVGLHHYSELHFDFIPLMSLPSFLLGMSVYFMKDNVKRWNPYIRNVIHVFVLFSVVFSLYQPYFYKNYSGQLAPLFAFLILMLASVGEKVSIKQSKLLPQLGDLSYAIYILHWPIYEIYGLILERLGVPSRHTITIFASYVLLVLIISKLAVQLQAKFFSNNKERNIPLHPNNVL